MIVQDIINSASILLQDTAHVRWSADWLRDCVSDSYTEIINKRPDAHSEATVHACALGARQSMADRPEVIRVIDVVANTVSLSKKGSVRKIDRRVLDDQVRSWRGATPTVDIELYMLDPNLPKDFLVYPPAAIGAGLEVVVSTLPDRHSGNSEDLRIGDNFAGAILDYVLYRSFSRDAETGNAARAAAHYQAMINSLT